MTETHSSQNTQDRFSVQVLTLSVAEAFCSDDWLHSALQTWYTLPCPQHTFSLFCPISPHMVASPAAELVATVGSKYVLVTLPAGCPQHPFSFGAEVRRGFCECHISRAQWGHSRVVWYQLLPLLAHTHSSRVLEEYLIRLCSEGKYFAVACLEIARSCRAMTPADNGRVVGKLQGQSRSKSVEKPSA